MEKIISDQETLLQCVNEYGILPFWDENGFSAWSFSAVSFMKLWNIREKLVNSGKVVYGKFVNKKSTFVSLDVFPYLAALRRDGYDFDSLVDEGRAPRREIDVMNAIGEGIEPSYALGKSLEIKGFDGVVTSLQSKTFLCVTFKKSSMGTALLSKPENIYGYDYVRAQYGEPAEKLVATLERRVKGLRELDEKVKTKLLTSAV